MVVVNLYDFAKVAANKDAPLEELIENIDIGGPTMIRAAAKNWQDVAVVVSPADYDTHSGGIIQIEAGLSKETCWNLALKAWATTAAYDQRRQCATEWIACPRFACPEANGSCDTVRTRTSRPRCTPTGSGGIAGAKQIAREGVILQQPSRSRCRLAAHPGV